MTDEQATHVMQSLESLLMPHRRVRRYRWVVDPAKFKEVIKHVSPPSGPKVAEFDLQMVTVMCLLGPRGLPPPSDLRGVLLGIIAGSAPNDTERLALVRDIVIAFGCNRWELPVGVHGAWGPVWPEARSALEHYITFCVRSGQRWLRTVVPGLGGVPAAAFPPSAASFIVDLLLSPTNPLAIAPGHELRISHDGSGALVCVAPVGGAIAFRPPGTKIVFEVAAGGAERDWGGRSKFQEGTEIVIIARDDGVEIRAFIREAAAREYIPRGGARLGLAEFSFASTISLNSQHTRVSQRGIILLTVAGVLYEIFLPDSANHLQGLGRAINQADAGITARLSKEPVSIRPHKFFLLLKGKQPGALPITIEDVGSNDAHIELLSGLWLGPTVKIVGPANLCRWRCSCGSKHCPQRHRLSAWQPHSRPYVSLMQFTRKAVLGL
jgi:hypothetical protein